MFLGDDIDNPHVALGVVLGGRRRDNLHVLDMPGGDLLQCLRAGEHARLAIDIDHEAAAPAECHLALGVHPDRRGVFENIHRRAAPRHHVGRGFHHLLIQFIDNLALRRYHFHLGDAHFEGFQPQNTQLHIGGSLRRHHNATLRQHIIPHQAGHQRIAPRLHSDETEMPVRVRKSLLHRIFIAFRKKKEVGIVDCTPVGIIDQLPGDAPLGVGSPGRQEKHPQKECREENFHGLD